MNRRQSLKAIGISTVTTGILLAACKTDKSATVVDKDNLDKMTGLQDFEKERLTKLKNEPAFFNEHERLTLILLGDIIIPKDEVSGSASDAKVIEFIDFIVKDMPTHQIPLRGGLKWLDLQSLNRYGQSFREATTAQQMELVQLIAYPDKATPDMHQGAIFFSRVRDLTATGFYTSQMGIKDIGYMGNVPHIWEGVPKDVLAQYNLKED